MTRTPAQNYRRKTNTFRKHCADYAADKRKRPPRVKYGTTIPNWSQIAKDLGMDPKDVYDDYRWYYECKNEAERLRIPLEDAMSLRWEKHCMELEQVRKSNKQGPRVVEQEIEEVPSYLNSPEARRLADVLLTKFRSKET